VLTRRLAAHGLDVEEGMLTGDAVYWRLKPLLDGDDRWLQPRMLCDQGGHWGPQGSEEAGTIMPKLCDRRERRGLLCVLVPPFYLDGC
jgi:hypothetical protein